MSKTCLAALCSACLVVPAAAQAGQKPHTPVLADEVIVTQSASGEELRGRLLELSPESLAILVDGRRVDLPIDTVLRIDARTDPVKDGAIIGAAIMGAASGVSCAAYGGTASCVTGIIVEAGLGALIGAGVDALHKGRTPIYIKPAKSGAAIGWTIRF
jgi:hypothetical protein